MQSIAAQLSDIVERYGSRLADIPEEVLSAKPRPDKWSKKEILGHLVDSAQNNARRFIVGQYEETPTIVYNQDRWVSVAGYQRYPGNELVVLWQVLNHYICRVLEAAPPGAGSRTVDTRGPQPRSIEWLATDYCKHLLHHLHQILELEPVSYP